jgi:ESS family glutamate:Na+ symporter
MSSYEFGGFVSFTLAIILLFLGKPLVGKVEILRRYSIPEPVIGGSLCAASVGVAYRKNFIDSLRSAGLRQ